MQKEDFIYDFLSVARGFADGSADKNLPAMRVTWV